MISARLEAFVADRLARTRMPGISLVLLTRDATEERHFGFRDAASRRPAGSGTRYGIGSVTKLVTALAVHRLHAAGALDLHAPIAAALPEIAGRFPSGTTPTLLLAHASGMPALGFSESKMNASWFMDGLPVGDWGDVATFLDGSERWADPSPQPTWRYSNEGYLALGALIEAATGERYVDHVRRTVLEPLGMHRSTFERADVEADGDRVTPTMQADDGTVVPGANLYGPVPAAGGLVSTPHDMAALARTLMQRGIAPGGATVLDEAAFARFATPLVPLDPPAATPFDDLALWNDPRRFHAAGPSVQRGVPGVHGDVVGHGGGVMGGTAYLAAAPDDGIGVVALASTHGYPLARIALAALVDLAGRDPADLPFAVRERLSHTLAGDYRAFRDTIRAELRPTGAGLDLVFDFRPARRTVRLTFLDHDPRSERTRLIAWTQGRPSIATIAPAKVPERPLELRYERYALRRQGRLLP